MFLSHRVGKVEENLLRVANGTLSGSMVYWAVAKLTRAVATKVVVEKRILNDVMAS